MGVEPYLLASTISGIVAQRLVRRICDACKQPISVPAESKHLFGDNVPETIHQGAGCQECGGIGYRGRVGVFEVLTMNAELRRLLFARASEDEMMAAARASGLSTLREQALALVRQGVTTLEDVTRDFHDLEECPAPTA
jgi:type II secretory ATPase GspE/PulE/Tfp pilus assembly ATPase PilB-like protein